MSDSTTELVSMFRAAWRETLLQSGVDAASAVECESLNGESLNAAMTALLRQTNARAVGCWRRMDDELVQVSFIGAQDMPSDVVIGFRQATGRAAMHRIELGCVRAAAERRPVVAREDAVVHGLTGSASWLQRFEAQQSLAIPIFKNGEETVRGVIAIATAAPFNEDSPTWQLLAKVASDLGSQ